MGSEPDCANNQASAEQQTDDPPTYLNLYPNEANPKKDGQHPANAKKAKREKPKWTDIAIVILTGGIVGAALLQTWIFYSGGSQTDKLISAANLIEMHLNQTVLDNQKAVILEQRPYMVMEGTPVFTDHAPMANEQARADLHIINIGKTPAIKMRSATNFLEYRDTNEDAAAKFMKDQFAALDKQLETPKTDKYYALIRHDLAPNQGNFGTQQTKEVLSFTDIQDLVTGKLKLFYIGAITYTDAFGNAYRTEICQFWFGTDPRIWHNCASYNTIQ